MHVLLVAALLIAWTLATTVVVSLCIMASRGDRGLRQSVPVRRADRGTAAAEYGRTTRRPVTG